MSSSELLQDLLEDYADTSGDLDLRSTIGEPGYRIEVRNETVDTGQVYEEPSFMSGLLAAIGGMMDRIQQDEVVVSNPLGQSSFTLTHAPRSASHLQVHKNGALLKKTNYSLTGVTLNVTAAFGDWLRFDYWY